MEEKMTETETIEAIADHIRAIIGLLGEDTEREGLKKTLYVPPRHCGMPLRAIAWTRAKS